MTDTGTVIYLEAEPATLRGRVGDVSSRPLLHGGNPVRTIARILDERQPLYRSTAHRIIDTSTMSRREVVEEVIEAWNAT